MNIPVYKRDDAPAFYTDGRPRLFELVRKADGTPECINVHPTRWDEYLAAITATGAEAATRPTEIQALLAMVKACAS